MALILLFCHRSHERFRYRSAAEEGCMTTFSSETGALVQLVTFALGESEYALDITRIQEVNRIGAITILPNAEHCVEGIINLRGKIVPIINLRARFGLNRDFDRSSARIIVVEAGVTVGLIVDAVSEVLRISTDSIESPPEMTVSESSRYLRGIIKLSDKLIGLLDATDLVGTPGTQTLAIVQN